MNSAGKHAVVALLVISITGCVDKKTKPIQPATAQAPSVDAGKAGAMYPPPLTSAQTQPEVPPPAPPPAVAQAEPEPPPQPAPQKTRKPSTSAKKSKPAPAKPTTPASSSSEGTDTPATATQTPAPAGTSPAQTEPSTDVAANGEPAPASPIGQLSTGDVSGQAQTRKETVDLITNTENGLNGIKRTLNTQEQETASQIRAFLGKARAALSNDDLDGALILATKAKVLLDELNKS